MNEKISVNQDVLNPQNPLHDLLDIYNPSFFDDKLVDGILKDHNKSKFSHFIRESLTHDEQQLLLQNYPEYNLIFSNRLLHPHAFAAASRKLEYRILIDKLGFNGDTVIPQGYDDLVCDIGGEFTFHLLNNHSGVHSCNPLLDVRDATRCVTRREQLFRCTLSKDLCTYLNTDRYNRILRYFSDSVFSRSVSCNHKAQDCNRSARYGICLHSSYDISLDDFAEIMMKKNMYEIHGSFIFSDIVLLEKEGFIPGINTYFSTFEENGVKYIEFSFKGDSSTCYRHKLSDYLALVTLNYFVHKPTNTTFTIELGENRAGVQFFKIVRVNGAFPNSSLTRYIWLKSLEGKTKINFFDVNEEEISRGNYKKAFPRVSFYVDTELVDKIVAHAYASTESKFRPIEIFNFITAYNGRIFFGSDVCIRNKPLPVYQSMLLANAIYVYVYTKKYKLGKIDQFLLNEVKHQRELAEGSLTKKFFKSKSTPPAHYDGGHAQIRLVRAFLAPLHRFLFWFKKSRYEAVKYLEETVKFEKCCSVIKSCDYTIVDNDSGRIFTHTVMAASVLDESKVFNIQNYIVDLLDKYVINGKVLKSEDLLPSNRYIEPIINISVTSAIALDNQRKFMREYIYFNGFSNIFVNSFKESKINLEGNTLYLKVDKSVSNSGMAFYLVEEDVEVVGTKVVSKRCNLLCDILRMLTYLPIVNVVVGDVLNASELVAVLHCMRDCQKVFVPAFFNVDEVSNFIFGHFKCVMSKFMVFGAHEDSLKKFFLMYKAIVSKSLSKFLAIVNLSLRVRKNVTVSEDKPAKLDDGYSVCKAIEPGDDVVSFDNIERLLRICNKKVSTIREILAETDETDSSASEESEEELDDDDDPENQCAEEVGVVERVVDCVEVIEDRVSVQEPDLGNGYMQFLPYSDAVVFCDKFLEDFKEDVVKDAIVRKVPTKNFSKGDFASRSAFKIMEILDKFEISAKRVLDVCGGPGGFAQVLLCGGCSVDGISLEGPVDYILSVKQHKNFSKLGCDIGDVNVSNMYDLVLCDGCPVDAKYGCENMGAFGDLLLKELDFVQHNCSANAVVKVFAGVSQLVRDRITVVASGFERVEFVRPLHSNPLSGEFYIVFISKTDIVMDHDLIGLFNSVNRQKFLHLQDLKRFIFDSNLVNSLEMCHVNYRNWLKNKFRLDGAEMSFYNGRVVLNDLLVSNKVQFENFLKINLGKCRTVNGKMGERREWLFATRSYSYGTSVIRPVGDFSLLLPLIEPIVRYNKLEMPNACLLVNYPNGSHGLNLHSDKEEAHRNQQVISVCLGDTGTIILSDLAKNIEHEFNVVDGQYYFFRNQDGFLHGVKDIKGSKRGRWVFTFRCFKDEERSNEVLDTHREVTAVVEPTVVEEPIVVVGEKPFVEKPAVEETDKRVLLVPDDRYHNVLLNAVIGPKIISKSKYILYLGGEGHCLFYCLSGGNIDTAMKLRNYILLNAPKTVPGKYQEFYSYEEIAHECKGSEWGGTTTMIAFCHLFNYNLRVFNTAGGCVFECCEYEYPTGYIELAFTGNHYDRFNSCKVDYVRLFPMSFDSIDLKFFLDVFIKTFQSERTFIDTLLLRGNLLPKDFFFNVVSNYCFNFNCKCLCGVRALLDKKPKMSLLLLHERMPGLNEILNFLSERKYNVRFLVMPGMSNFGYFFLLIDDGVYQPINLVTCMDHNRNHMSNCLKCISGQVISPPYYNGMYRTYYFCERNDPVRTVPDLSEADKVFKIVTKKTTNTLVEKEDCVEVPMKFKTKNLLDASRNELKKVQYAVDEYIDRCGGLISVGIDAPLVENLSVLVQILGFKVSCIYIKQSDSIFSSSGPNFRPKFFPFVDDNSYIVNSMIEVREYYRAALETVKAQVKPLHDQYVGLVSSPKFNGGQNSFNNKPDYALIDMTTGTYVVAPKSGGGPYMYAYNGTDLVDISSANSSKDINKNFGNSPNWIVPGVFRGYHSVCKETKIINSGVIYNFLRGYDLSSFTRNFKIELVEGVPGCGKTHYIVNNHEFSSTNSKTVVLTSSREAAADLRRRVAAKYNIPESHKSLRKNYRTVDSFLMHYSENKYDIDTIWLDEGLMRHFGDVMWCAHVSGCKRIIIIGDRAQIPFICRIPGVVLRYELPALTESMDVKFLSVTHRCPVDVAALLNRFGAYSEPVTSSSIVRRSINVKYIKNLNDLGQGYRDFQFLTFTQGDKEIISKQYGYKVNTVNEFQGNQAENIVLVRLQPKDVPIFKSKNHKLVGISRHTKMFLYATVVQDEFSKFLHVPISENELNSCMTKVTLSVDGKSYVTSSVSYNLAKDKVKSKFKGGGMVLGKVQCRQFPLFNVVPRAAVMIDMLKQDRQIRDFVQDNFGTGSAPFRVDFREVEICDVDLPSAPPYYVSDPLTTMQYYYDIICPGQSLPNYDYDNQIFEQDDLNFAVKENIILSRYEKFFKMNFDCLTPNLRTSCPSPVTNSIKHILKAFYDRNGNVPELQGDVDDYKMAETLFKNFVDTYVVDKELFSRFREEPINVNVDSIEDWLFTQSPDVKKKAFPDEINCIFMKELNRYSMILKKLPKPKLEPGAEYKFPSPQTIAHSTKDVNAVFCPIIKEVKKRLYSVLSSNVVIFSDMSIDEFEKLLTLRLSKKKMKKFKRMLEQDFAKYDKSQNRLALMFELLILLALGFPPELIATWIFMHVYSRIMNMLNGFKAKVFFQRKSGDPMTYLGNTLFLMAVFCTTGLDIIAEKIKAGLMFVMFSGDDLLAFMDEDIDTSFIASECAMRFNLESKILNFSTAYFCSKFLFMTPWGRWVMVPDVVKMLTKLGRRDLVNYEHVEEYRISCLDVAKHLGNSVLYPLIDTCINDRYKLGFGSYGGLYSAMYACFSSAKNFSKLYSVRDGFNIDSLRKFTKNNDF